MGMQRGTVTHRTSGTGRSRWARPARWAAAAAALAAPAVLACGVLASPAFAADNNSGNSGNADNSAGMDQNAVAAAIAAPLVAGTPCTITARACVDLDSQRAWLFADGAIVRGPVKVATGGHGKPTPVGHSLRVYRRDKDFKSTEFLMANGKPAPMPYSVFFADGGIAFHAGSPAQASAGCVHLNPADAQAWFNYLAIGDQVQVVKASQELPRHKGQPTVSKKPGTIDPFRGDKSGTGVTPGADPSGTDGGSGSGSDDSHDSGDSDSGDDSG